MSIAVRSCIVPIYNFEWKTETIGHVEQIDYFILDCSCLIYCCFLFNGGLVEGVAEFLTSKNKLLKQLQKHNDTQAR